MTDTPDTPPTEREAVARAVWETLGSDYTFEEAVSGPEKALHSKAISWVYQIADVSIDAINQEREGQ